MPSRGLVREPLVHVSAAKKLEKEEVEVGGWPGLLGRGGLRERNFFSPCLFCSFLFLKTAVRFCSPEPTAAALT